MDDSKFIEESKLGLCYEYVSVEFLLKIRITSVAWLDNYV